MQVFLENTLELVVSGPLLNLVWIAAFIVILVDVLFFLAWVVLASLESLLESMTVATVLGAMVLVATVLILSLMKSGCGAAVTLEETVTVGEDGCPAEDAVETDAAVDDDEEDGRPITAGGAVHVLPFLVVIGLVILASLLDSLNCTNIFAVAGYGVAFALVWGIGVAEDYGVDDNGDGCPSGTVIETKDKAWTLDGDGCQAEDAVETDAAVDKEDNGRPVTATAEVPFVPRRSPRIAAQTQTRVEPRRSPRLAANRERANSLRNAGLQPRRSARIALARLAGGV